ncbi:Uu.00g009340.m01.CDS01 [Anthostomella pinea]|uniref:Uu.00g009340.m01.CDS01 n=1 Tax=Anthostomella pinea TaxID=933095 RepID=A0AAI8YQ00_9PEZI|nr:Uu.00g009340.m01.CDS01 [Anthostomella pinea]
MGLVQHVEPLAQVVFAHWAVAIVATVSFYASFRCFYNLYFHPAAKYPGPRLAAISNIWITGKYPSVIAKAHEKYGDVVRISPNELVFITPKAASDIFASQVKGLEYFLKADFISLGWPDQGITWETDPVKHHQKAKWLLPSFSAKSLREKEDVMHKYIDIFVQNMMELGNGKEGIELRKWADWLAMDIAADLGYSREMRQLEEKRPSPYLESIWAANFFVTMHTTAKKFPLLGWLQYFSVPPSAIVNYVAALGANKKAFYKRIDALGQTQHPDHFGHLLDPESPLPAKRYLQSLEAICLHLLPAGYEPISSSFFGIIAFSLQDRGNHGRLVKEIRDVFISYEDIAVDTVTRLDFLHATVMEQLRVAVVGATGQPRVSPGATVDGLYIAKGVEVQYANYAFTRNSRYFHEPYSYRPQRWLRQGHPFWDPVYAKDAREDFHPWGQGIRACPGMILSLQEIKLIVAMVLWALDVKMLPGQHVDFDRDFELYGMLEKPDLWVRFNKVAR